MIRPKIKFLLTLLLLFSWQSRARANGWLDDVDHALFGANPDVENYNAGVSLYRAGKFDEALSKFQLAGTSQDKSLKAKALHNAALVHVQKKELPVAQDLLKQALAFDNDSKEIRENLEWVEKQIAEQDPRKDQKQQDQKTADQKDQKDQKGEEKPAEQKSAEEKKAEEKSAEQKSAEQKSAEQKSAEEKAAQDQKAAEEKNAEKSKEGEQGSEEKKTAEQKAGEEKQDGKDEAGKERDKVAQTMREQEKNPDKDKPGKQEGMIKGAAKEEKVLTTAEIKQQEAERLLREIDDKIGQYPQIETEATGKRGNDGKNW